MHAVERLQAIFVRVATTGVIIDLALEPGIRLNNISALELTCAEDEMRKTLSRASRAGFRWTCSAHKWHRRRALLDAFAKGPGHHYLTEEGIDDALIEISYGEDHPGMD